MADQERHGEDQGKERGAEKEIALYNRYRGQLRTGDHLGWRSKTAVGFLIRLFSSAEINHSGLVIRLKEFQGLQDRRFTIEALEHGIVLRLLSERLSHFKGELYWYPLKAHLEHHRPMIAAWALNHLGVPYDFGSLFRNILGRVSQNAERFFCSEFCYMAWKASGIPLVWWQAPTPGDIDGLTIFEKKVRIF